MKRIFPLLAIMLLAVLIANAAQNPKVLMKTDLGDITVEIFVDKAPITAANFLKYVDNKLYDGAAFFRTVTMDNQPKVEIKIEVIQGGQLADDKEFPAIMLERTSVTGIKHTDGAISMARDGPDSATSSFFICVGDQPELDFGGRRNKDGQGFAAFGKVMAGMDVVKKIHQSPKENQNLKPPIKIISITRISD
jgi:peptidyl-prolyl cis-trans isomerase A (cyclophilin A)